MPQRRRSAAAAGMTRQSGGLGGGKCVAVERERAQVYLHYGGLTHHDHHADCCDPTHECGAGRGERAPG